MNHHQVIDQDLVGRYRRGRLTVAAAEDFETHLLDCRECQALLEIDARLERGFRTLAAEAQVREPRSRPSWARASLGIAATLLIAVSVSLLLRWPGAEPQVAGRSPPIAQAGLPVFQLALTRGGGAEAIVLRIPPQMAWYALEIGAPETSAPCCRVVIEDAENAVVWEGESSIVATGNVVRVLLSRYLLDDGDYRIVLYAIGADQTRLIEHEVRVRSAR